MYNKYLFIGYFFIEEIEKELKLLVLDNLTRLNIRLFKKQKQQVKIIKMMNRIYNL